MPASFSFGKIQFDVGLGNAATGKRRDPEAPFLLAVLGDFTGRTNRQVTDNEGTRRPIHVDCDNFDQLINRLGVALRLPVSHRTGEFIELQFESLEDFHPDELLKRVAPLSGLFQIRQRLGDSATAAAAVQEAQSLLAVPVPSVVSATPPTASGESVQETMARLLGGTPPPVPPASGKSVSAGIDINALIKGIVAPSVVPHATPEQSAALAAIELELTAQLRAILHHPDFQSLEAAWRGLELLVREFGGEENLKLRLMDVSKAELINDLRQQENLQETAMFKSLRGQDWAVLVGAYTFDDSVEDIEALGRTAKIAATLGSSFVAGASEHFVGCDSLTLHPDSGDWTRVMIAESHEAWVALRALPEASHLGLALPRVLLRQPYGKGSDPVDSFPFEELPNDATHEFFLWGNGAIVCGYLLAEAFRAEGWGISASGSGELDGLPVYKFTRDGESTVKPCAEVWMSERAGERILSRGLMPILSIKSRGAVRLANVQSVAMPSQRLFLRSAED